MSPFALIDHLANFAAPAFFLALVLALGGRLMLGKAAAMSLWMQVAVNFAAGLAVLAGGLFYLARAAMMATYPALVVVWGIVQWLVGGGLRK